MSHNLRFIDHPINPLNLQTHHSWSFPWTYTFHIPVQIRLLRHRPFFVYRFARIGFYWPHSILHSFLQDNRSSVRDLRYPAVQRVCRVWYVQHQQEAQPGRIYYGCYQPLSRVSVICEWSLQWAELSFFLASSTCSWISFAFWTIPAETKELGLFYLCHLFECFPLYKHISFSSSVTFCDVDNRRPCYAWSPMSSFDKSLGFVCNN